ncbi:hypothetical protein Agub_g140 [Astrephomene gubernaculifera]|uniref:Uncharacterized protein n=1 Tax=Astrephomene gubernaculifera TaxID=47775 RepID=A0AAD3DE88_9CHLO|nr:hypothetical protein Agub_g140 [Astrephomene gubernaculifera]
MTHRQGPLAWRVVVAVLLASSVLSGAVPPASGPPQFGPPSLGPPAPGSASSGPPAPGILTSAPPSSGPPLPGSSSSGPSSSGPPPSPSSGPLSSLPPSSSASQLVLRDDSVYDCKQLGIAESLFVISNFTSFSLRNATFRNCASPPLVLSVTAASTATSVAAPATLTDCRFESNNATSSTTSSSDSDSDTYEGASLVLLGAISATLTNCIFTANDASLGAAIYSTAGASGDGGLTLSGCSFSGNAGQGALYVAGGVLQNVSSCVFSGHSGGSAMVLYGVRSAKGADALAQLRNVTFEANSANLSTSSTSAFSSSAADAMTGRSGGAVFAYLGNVYLNFTSCRFINNWAARQGGALALYGTGLPVTLTSCELYGNRAGLYGGAVWADTGSDLVTQGSGFWNNSAKQGGALSASTSASLTLQSSNFTSNTAEKFGGAISATQGAELEAASCLFTANSATFAAAIECWTCTAFSVNSCTFSRNAASGSAGAVALYGVTTAATLAYNTFTGNTAATNSSVNTKDCFRDGTGQGGALCAAIQASLQLRGNNFTSNRATSGGAMYVSRKCDVLADEGTCDTASVALYEDNYLVGNTAVGGAGGAVYTLNVSALTVYCAASNTSSSNTSSTISSTVNRTVNSNGVTVYYWSGKELAFWPYLTTGCPGTWSRNSYTDGGYGGGLATGMNGVRIKGFSNSGGQQLVVANFSSNSVIPLAFELYDYLGSTMTAGSYEVDSTTVAVDFTGSDGAKLANYVGGSYSNTTVGGEAAFNSLKLTAPPGNYTLPFYGIPAGSTSSADYKQVTILVQVRTCWLGEVSEEDVDMCSFCIGPSDFSFNPLNTTCDACPDYAICDYVASSTTVTTVSYTGNDNVTYSYTYSDDNNSTDGTTTTTTTTSNSSSSSSNTTGTLAGGGYLVPEDGYWHSSPFSVQIHKCPVTAACTYTDRSTLLGAFQLANLSAADTNMPTPPNSVLLHVEDYWSLQVSRKLAASVCV